MMSMDARVTWNNALMDINNSKRAEPATESNFKAILPPISPGKDVTQERGVDVRMDSQVGKLLPAVRSEHQLAG